MPWFQELAETVGERRQRGHVDQAKRVDWAGGRFAVLDQGEDKADPLTFFYRLVSIVAALVVILAANSGPVQAQEVDTALVAVVTIDADGYVVLRNRLGRLEEDRHLAGVMIEIHTGQGDGETIMTGEIPYGLCEIIGSVDDGWDSVFCRTIPKGEERVLGLPLGPEDRRNVIRVAFHWDGRPSSERDGAWCTEVVATRGRRWDCFDPGLTNAASWNAWRKRGGK